MTSKNKIQSNYNRMIISIAFQRSFTGTTMDHAAGRRLRTSWPHVLILEFVRDKEHLRELKPDFC